MQIVEEIVGAFLLQQSKPTALLGSLACLLTGPYRGWVYASLTLASDEMGVEETGLSLKIQMSRDVALRLSSVVQLLVVQSGKIAASQPPPADHDCEVVADRALVTCTLRSSQSLLREEVDGFLEVRMHPSLAARLAGSIIEAVALYGYDRLEAARP